MVVQVDCHQVLHSILTWYSFMYIYHTHTLPYAIYITHQQALVSPNRRSMGSKSKAHVAKRKRFKSLTPKMTITRECNSTLNNDNTERLCFPLCTFYVSHFIRFLNSHKYSLPFRFSRSKSPRNKSKKKKKRQRSASVASSNDNLPHKYIPKPVHMIANSKKRKKKDLEVRIPIVWSDDDNLPMKYSKTPEPQILNSLIKSKSMKTLKKKKKKRKKNKKDPKRTTISWSSSDEQDSPLLNEEERGVIEILMPPKKKDTHLKHYASEPLITPGAEYLIPEETEILDDNILLCHKATVHTLCLYYKLYTQHIKSDLGDFLSTVSELSTCNIFNNGECDEEYYDDEEPEPDEEYLKPRCTFMATTTIDKYESGEEEENVAYSKIMKLSIDENVIDIHVNRMHIKLKYSAFYNISICDKIDDYYHRHTITKSTSAGGLLNGNDSPKLCQSSTSNVSVDVEV